MKWLLSLALVLLALPASAQIYKWTDAQGRVHFSNQAPPQGVKAVVVDPNAKEVPPAPAAEGKECHTIRCQGERLEERERQRAAVEQKEAAARAERDARAPKPHKGLAFAKYISIQRGMSEGELLGIAGEPDLLSDQGVAFASPGTVQMAPGVRRPARTGLSLKTWTYMPTTSDPFTTTITLVGGRVSEIERVRKF
ncbi:MAG: DUF4124 domain-containing protein [Betaproteobacteria bacterium]